MEQYEIEELPTLGWFTITECGEENMYFTLANGSQGFCKCFDGPMSPAALAQFWERNQE